MVSQINPIPVAQEVVLVLVCAGIWYNYLSTCVVRNMKKVNGREKRSSLSIYLSIYLLA